MTKKSSGWWRPDPGAACQLQVVSETTVYLASAVALSREHAQLAVKLPGRHALCVFSLKTGMSAITMMSWHVAKMDLPILQQLATGQRCGNCGAAAKCLRTTCPGWRPQTRAERKRRALPGPLERLEPGWESWTGGVVRADRRKRMTEAKPRGAVEELLEATPCMCPPRDVSRPECPPLCLSCRAKGEWLQMQRVHKNMQLTLARRPATVVQLESTLADMKLALAAHEELLALLKRVTTTSEEG